MRTNATQVIDVLLGDSLIRKTEKVNVVVFREPGYQMIGSQFIAFLQWKRNTGKHYEQLHAL